MTEKAVKNVKQDIINFVTTTNRKTINIADLQKQFPDFSYKQIANVVCGALKSKGVLKPLIETPCKSNPQEYQIVPSKFGNLKVRAYNVTKKPVRTKLGGTYVNDYAAIGKGIEKLLLDKNEEIAMLQKRIEKYEKRTAEDSKRINDLEVHIRNQGHKIYELSEKARKGNASIKLEELQAIVKQSEQRV